MFWDAKKTEALNERFRGKFFFLQGNYAAYGDYALVAAKGFTFEGPFYLDGRGNCIVLPITERGRLRELMPIPSAYTALYATSLYDYRVEISGREYLPENLLHFAINPGSFYPWRGEGFTVTLSTVADSLKQAAATETGFLQSKWKPSIIVKVDALADEFSTKAGRKKLLDEYVEGSEAGEQQIG